MNAWHQGHALAYCCPGIETRPLSGSARCGLVTGLFATPVSSSAMRDETPLRKSTDHLLRLVSTWYWVTTLRLCALTGATFRIPRTTSC